MFLFFLLLRLFSFYWVALSGLNIGGEGGFALSFCFLFCCICLLSLEACSFLKENQAGVNLEEWGAVGGEGAGKSGVGERNW